MRHAIAPKPRRPSWPTLAFALGASALLHLALLAGGGLGWVRPLAEVGPSAPTLSVRLRPSVSVVPTQPRATVAATPVLAPPEHRRTASPRTARVLRQPVQPLSTAHAAPTPPVITGTPSPRPTHSGAAPLPRVDTLLSQVAQFERQKADTASPQRDETQLDGDLGVDWQLYIDAWQQRIEQIGHQYFPDAVRRLGISGGPRLKVEINADGSLARVTLLRKSQYPVLDDAAIHIVRLARTFAPLPPRIAAQHKSMTITRTLVFGVDDSLATR
jgi:protein TonB